MAAIREAEGERDPLKVVYWGVGNEPWGCGGDFTAEDYAAELRRYTAWVPSFDMQLRYIAAGANSGDVEWTRRFFAQLTEGQPRDGQAALGLLVPPLRMERQQRPHDRLERGKGAGCRVHHGAVLRAAARRRQDGRVHRRALAGDGRVRQEPPREAGRGRVGRLAQARHRGAPVAHAGSDLDAARRAAGRPHARHLPPSRRQGRHGQHRAARQLPAVALRRSRGQVHRHAELRRLRDVHGPHGRAGGAVAVLRAARVVPAQRAAGDVLGAGGIGLAPRRQGRRRDGGEPERNRRQGHGDRRARREDQQLRNPHAHRAGARRAQLVRTARRRDRAARHDAGLEGRAARADVAEGVRVDECC